MWDHSVVDPDPLYMKHVSESSSGGLFWLGWVYKRLDSEPMISIASIFFFLIYPSLQ